MKRMWQIWPLLVAAVLVYVPMGGWKLLYGSNAADDPTLRRYGAEHPVPGFEWVVLLNPRGVSTADGRLAFFDQCLIRYGGTVQEVTSHFSWYAALSNDTLVEYRQPQGREARGVLCPDGAIFLLPSTEVGSYGARHAERQAYEADLAQTVNDAISSGPAAERTYRVYDQMRWVEALNPQGLESFGYAIEFMDACGLEQGGTVHALRNTSYGILYTYMPAPGATFRGVGIPCPPDTVFLQHGLMRRYF